MSAHVVNICAEFHSNPSTNYGDFTSRETDVNGQWTQDSRWTAIKHMRLSAYYFCYRHKNFWSNYFIYVHRKH